ncbi:MAG: HAMP domain-containing histidine kinase [Planctomycetes bacterium]|nr:HAMP domain-containing histidine kinase [Planctomycetota bacterium]
MSLAWRILLFALLLNVLTVGGVQIIVHQQQERWFREQRELLQDSVQESFTELERVYAPSVIDDATANASIVRSLLRNQSLRELYDDVIVTSGRPPYTDIYLNSLGAVHRDPDAFPLDEIVRGISRAREVDGLFPVANGYCRALRQSGRVVGYLWFVPKFRPQLPTSLPVWSALLGVLASTVLFGAVLFWLTRRTVARPLQDVGDAAQAVASGRYDVRLPEQRSVPELGPLVATFNRMAAQVEDHTRTLEQAVRAAVAATEQKERALVQSSRLATIGTLAAGVAHEINNPIGGMQNAVNRLLQNDRLEEKQRVYLQLLQDGLARVARTTRRMLEFAPKDAQPTAFDVRKAIDGAFALVEHRCVQEGVTFSLQVDDDLPAVHGDAHELQQVMLNLFLNSLDAIGGDGGAITVTATSGDGRVHIEVADDGPGMAAELQPRIFDPFFTRKERPDASGLGMFISYSIVQNHGGTMRIESAPGQGFRTLIDLPASS